MLRLSPLLCALALTACIDDTNPTNEVEDAAQADAGDAGSDDADGPLNDANLTDAARPDGAVPDGQMADIGPCLPVESECNAGEVSIPYCPDNDPQCRQYTNCGAVTTCIEDLDCDRDPPCPEGTNRVGFCAESDPQCTAFVECGMLVTCSSAECEGPGTVVGSCREGWRYNPDTECTAGEVEWGCTEETFCGDRYTCERESVDLSEVCGEWDLGPLGDCDARDGQRCRTVIVEGVGSVQCFDPRCIDETLVEQFGCPDIPGARNCYPNEEGCDPDGEFVWCGVTWPGCTLDEIDCDGFPNCDPGTIELMSQGCGDSDGVCPSLRICQAGDSTCTTLVTCGAALACFDEERCANYVPPGCPAGTRAPDAEERAACRQREDRCGETIECSIATVCVPE